MREESEYRKTKNNRYSPRGIAYLSLCLISKCRPSVEKKITHFFWYKEEKWFSPSYIDEAIQ